MQRLAGILALLLAGVLAGAASAYGLIEMAGIESGGEASPWRSRSAAMTVGASPYVSSHFLLAGRLATAPGQFAEAVADVDDEGRPLTSSCQYVLTAGEGLPRWWTLAALGDVTPSQQAVTDAGMAVRAANGSLTVTAALKPEPGNWLKLPQARRFSFLYLARPTGRKGLARPVPFRIAREGC
jgi:hypothetical protein